MTIQEAIAAAIAAGKRRDLATAVDILTQVVRQDPKNGLAWSNLANAYSEMDRVDEALGAIAKANEFFPQNPAPYRIHGGILTRLHRHDEAVKKYEQAVAVAPNDPESHGWLAHALLLAGDLERGFAEYEWRWKVANFTDPARPFAQPRWTGQNIGGKRVMIYAEQGIGDLIQFIRYAPLLAERGASVIVEGWAELARLIRRMPSVSQFVPRGEKLPAFDFQSPVLSLPLAFKATLRTIPANVPYLFAEAKEKIRPEAGPAKLRVGIAWAGRPTHIFDRFRSCKLSDFAPLAAVQDVTFYSLQKGPAAAQASAPPSGMTLIDQTNLLNDFDDTASLIANLDLVISVDTAVAHLAGAMGKPVWTLLHHPPEWRWMMNRADSPWYPTMRLFRQPERGNWASVFTRVAEALRTMREQSASHRP